MAKIFIVYLAALALFSFVICIVVSCDAKSEISRSENELLQYSKPTSGKEAVQHQGFVSSVAGSTDPDLQIYVSQGKEILQKHWEDMGEELSEISAGVPLNKIGEEDFGEWVPIGVKVEDCQTIKVTFCRLAEGFYHRHPEDVSFFSHLVQVSGCANSTLTRSVSLEVAEELLTNSGVRVNLPTGFIYHQSRCGSTAISNLLVSNPDIMVASEPVFLEQALAKCQKCPFQEKVSLFRTIVLLLGRSNQHRFFFIKFTPTMVWKHEILKAAFPTTPWVFIHRNPHEVVGSYYTKEEEDLRSVMSEELRQKTTYCLSGYGKPADLSQIKVAAALKVKIDEPVSEQLYCIGFLQAICKAAAEIIMSSKGLGIPVLYNRSNLAESFLENVMAKHFQVQLQPEEITKMLKSSNRYSKPNFRLTEEERDFVSDTLKKKRALTSDQKELVDSMLAPVYQELIQLSKPIDLELEEPSEQQSITELLSILDKKGICDTNWAEGLDPFYDQKSTFEFFASFSHRDALEELCSLGHLPNDACENLKVDIKRAAMSSEFDILVERTIYTIQLDHEHDSPCHLVTKLRTKMSLSPSYCEDLVQTLTEFHMEALWNILFARIDANTAADALQLLSKPIQELIFPDDTAIRLVFFIDGLEDTNGAIDIRSKEAELKINVAANTLYYEFKETKLLVYANSSVVQASPISWDPSPFQCYIHHINAQDLILMKHNLKNLSIFPEDKLSINYEVVMEFSRRRLNVSSTVWRHKVLKTEGLFVHFSKCFINEKNVNFSMFVETFQMTLNESQPQTEWVRDLGFETYDIRKFSVCLSSPEDCEEQFILEEFIETALLKIEDLFTSVYPDQSFRHISQRFSELSAMFTKYVLHVLSTSQIKIVLINLKELNLMLLSLFSLFGGKHLTLQVVDSLEERSTRQTISWVQHYFPTVNYEVLVTSQELRPLYLAAERTLLPSLEKSPLVVIESAGNLMQFQFDLIHGSRIANPANHKVLVLSYFPLTDATEQCILSSTSNSQPLEKWKEMEQDGFVGTHSITTHRVKQSQGNGNKIPTTETKQSNMCFLLIDGEYNL